MFLEGVWLDTWWHYSSKLIHDNYNRTHFKWIKSDYLTIPNHLYLRFVKSATENVTECLVNKLEVDIKLMKIKSILLLKIKFIP